MKRIKLFLIICGITICACGCNQNSNKGFSENSSEKDAIISIFGEYTSIKGTGIVQINEKEDENDRTYIYYLVKVPSLENYKNELKKEKSEQNQENILAKMYNEVQEDVTQEVISKIDKLYINKNVNKIIYFLKGYGILNFALKKQFLSVGKDAERWIMVKFYLQERK